MSWFGGLEHFHFAAVNSVLSKPRLFDHGHVRLNSLSPSDLSYCLQLSCFLNAAQACLNDNEWGDAIAHATSALGKDPDNVKALYRRGVARCVAWVVRPA